MDFDTEINKMNEYELRREKNIKEFESLISDFGDEIDNSVNRINALKTFNEISREPSKNKRRSDADPTYVFSGALPYEIRRSARLSNGTPEYSYEDLIDNDTTFRKRKYVDDKIRRSGRLSNGIPEYSYEDLMDNDTSFRRRKYVDDKIEHMEKVIFRRKRSLPRRPATAIYVPAEEITEQYLDKVSMRVVNKVYSSENGTSCHQCRQKTLDSKTYCRSGSCVGVRGQFCGVCLKNRYGEDAKTALLDPKWKCPPCRGLCNCSICRTREGKRPTGILAPLAFQYGHKSVKDFLITLKGKGDYVDELPRGKHKKQSHNDKRKKHCDDCQLLLGFNHDLKPLWVAKSDNLLLNVEEGNLVGFNIDKESVMI